MAYQMGDEHQVNTGTAGSQDQPSITALKGGGYVVAWRSTEPGSSGIKMQRYDSSGQKVGGEALVSATLPDAPGPQVTALEGGGFLVSWVGVPFGSGLRGQLYDSSGGKIGAEFPIVSGVVEEPDVAALPNGGFAVAWHGRTSDDSIDLQLFDQTGAPTSSRIPVAGGNNTHHFADPSIAVTGPNSLVVVWEEPLDRATRAPLGPAAGATFDLSGNRLTTFKVDGRTDMGVGDQRNLNVTALGDGRFLITYESVQTELGTGTARSSYLGEIRDASGARVSEPFPVEAGTSPQPERETVATGDGGFIRFYRAGDGSEHGLYAQRYDDLGFRLGDPVLVNAVTAGLQYDPNAARLADGRIVVAWTDNSGTGGDTSPPAIKGRILAEVPGPVTSGTGGDDVLTGGATGDTIEGGNGNDHMVGGAGNDVLRGGEGLDYLQGDAGDNILDGGGGNDTIHGGNDRDRIIGGTGDDILVGNGGNDRLEGGDGVDNLSGGDGADSLHGGAGNDMMSGGAGNDRMDGGTGADYMDGGSGDDTYIVDDAGDVVAEQPNGGFDTVRTSVDHTMRASVDNLFYTGTGAVFIGGNDEHNSIDVTGSSQALVVAGGGNDVVSGGAGHDNLQGGAGADVINGGDGDDYLQGDAGSNTLLGGAGNDALNGGDDGETLRGGAGKDTVLGNGGIDTIHGDEGDDNLLGGDGNDLIYGGVGDDALHGGAGNDRLEGGTGADYLNGGAGDDLYIVDDTYEYVGEEPGAGIDTVQTSVNFSIRANVENLTYTGSGFVYVEGNDIANVINVSASNGALITGGGGDDAITGGSGNDNLAGNAGDDTILGGNGHDYLQGDAGANLLDGGSGNDQLNGGDDGETLLGGTGDDLILGNGGIDRLEGGTGNDYLDAGAGDDLLLGQEGNESLIGRDGNDALHGGAGSDAMDGGAGTDRFVYDQAAADKSIDRIYNFSRPDGDIVDLSIMDANTAAAGNQAFTYIGNSAFSGAGQLRLFQDGDGRWAAQGDVDGDGVADFTIVFHNPVQPIDASDFIL